MVKIDKKYVVYKITNTINNKIYIGMTGDLKTRWSGNGRQYKPFNNDTHRPFWNAINKYGWDNFQKEVIEDNLTFDEAIEGEIFYIAFFNATNKDIGYNVSPGGNGGKIYLEHPKGMLGKHHTEENRLRQSEFMKANNPMVNVKWGETHKHPKGMKGKKQTEHQRAVARSLKSSAKKVSATFPDGTTKTFNSVKECAEYLDVNSSSSFFIKLLKTNQPYKLSPKTTHNREKLKSLEGLILKYVS